ncbi:hypothetical protein HJC10_26585 [Corallococcus exiguus]|uniref:hypothetical protein n=1 Tax=Corallococcus TaxID=83461 RepID=UPI000ECA6A47|nr:MULTISPECIES: hypothetical protein [Corallococcus]NNB85649.1 hypothetical protein [Corallococcus exiguus]NNB98471.1 hypothetical protein [Corallococcus exiguus]NNC06404.1 hypothetical protein [Corallococcus exiguus]NPC46297.1 hypothetical protein [Corallococcus exiguus]RKH78878.1 hypothetical protein D7X99_26655 [Corallococcus sp. AB032C]
MRTFLIGGLLAMAVGCGGPMEQEEEPNLTSQEAPLPDCATSPTNIRTYYDANNWVIGERGCDCGDWIHWGQISSIYDIRTSC